MQAPYIRPGVIPLPKLLPVAFYDPQRQVATIANAYPIREVVKAAGYRWHEASKTWRRECTLEDLRADWELFQSLGVDLDAATAALLATPVKPETVKAAVDDDNDALFGPPVVDYPIKSTPKADASSLTRARERILRLAASGRIKDQKDLEELRSIAGLIRQAIEVA